MQLIIKMNMDNAAFDASGTEASRILRGLADKLELELSSDPFDTNIGLRDINGNTVGYAIIK